MPDLSKVNYFLDKAHTAVDRAAELHSQRSPARIKAICQACEAIDKFEDQAHTLSSSAPPHTVKIWKEAVAEQRYKLRLMKERNE